MAYAGIAGLPPQAGLYTLVASLLIYALLGTSRHLSVQATSATAALLATSVAARGGRRGRRVRSQDLRGLRGRLRARHRRRVPRGRPRQAGLHHAVPLQAGDGRLRGRPRHLRDGGAALQALRRGEARGQHGREARGDDQGAARGQLDHLRGGSRGAGAALPAAAPEQEDPGRPGRAVRGDRAERGARSRGHLRRGGRGHAAAGAAVARAAGRAALRTGRDGGDGDRRPAGGLQRGAGRRPRVRREARLRGRRRPGAQRPRRGQPGERPARRHDRRRQHVGVGREGGRRRPHPGRQPGRLGRDDRDPALPHARCSRRCPRPCWRR